VKFGGVLIYDHNIITLPSSKTSIKCQKNFANLYLNAARDFFFEAARKISEIGYGE